jgi:hypothetical protein
MSNVIAKLETLSVPTYGLGRPEKNPVFFEKRVYQGSCGKVYPVPFIDKVFQDQAPEPVDYVAARLENDFVRLVMLPEIGGRIFIGQDKSNHDYDFFYRQEVIKPRWWVGRAPGFPVGWNSTGRNTTVRERICPQIV